MGKKKSFLEVLGSWWGGIIVILTGFIVLLCVYPGNNIFTLVAAKHEIYVQEKQIRELKEDIRRLDGRINVLKTDRDSLEKFARDNFHLAVPGEEVFLVDE